VIIGITASSFAPYHAGHSEMLRWCKNFLNKRDKDNELWVLLQTDPTKDRPEKRKPIQTVVERYLVMESVKYISRIFPYETEEDLENFLKAREDDINYRFIDESYKEREFTAKDGVAVEIIYNPRRHNWSSTRMINEIRRKK